MQTNRARLSVYPQYVFSPLLLSCRANEGFQFDAGDRYHEYSAGLRSRQGDNSAKRVEGFGHSMTPLTWYPSHLLYLPSSHSPVLDASAAGLPSPIHPLRLVGASTSFFHDSTAEFICIHPSRCLVNDSRLSPHSWIYPTSLYNVKHPHLVRAFCLYSTILYDWDSFKPRLALPFACPLTCDARSTIDYHQSNQLRPENIARRLWMPPSSS